VSKTLAEQGAQLLLAFEMFEVGVAMMRQNLRRKHPTASDETIEAELEAWLRHRPGAEAGDAEGVSVDWASRHP
jgi:hypothetical protein